MKRFLSILLATIILFGNLGFTLGTHYCGGHAVETKLMLGEGDLNCGMEVMEQSCNALPQETSFSQTTCCKNEYSSLEVDIDFKKELQKLNFNYDFLISEISYYDFEINPLNIATNNFVAHSPPILKQNKQILFQTFLI